MHSPFFLCSSVYNPNIKSHSKQYIFEINYLIFEEYEIRDLESSNSDFLSEASLWTASSTLVSSLASQCSGVWLLGGYGVVGAGTTYTRTYTSLSPHTSIYFHFDVWLIDFDVYADIFKMYFDDQFVNDFTTIGSDFTWGSSSFCGGSRGEYASIKADGQARHSGATLKISMISAIRSGTDVFSFGIRGLYLSFQSSPVPSDLTCQFRTYSTSAAVSCSCAQGQYNPSGASGCQSCYSMCQSCIGPYSTNCTSCRPGYSFNGQTCYQCDTSCNQCNGTTASDCVRCNSGKYLYWNGTCQATCTSPLLPSTSGTYSFCNLPCNTPGDYFFSQNISCGPRCPSAAFTQASQGDLRLCSFKCTGGGYLYWNGTCSSSCGYPLVNSTSGVERYCKLPCSTSEFFYENGSCLTSCPASSFVEVDKGDLKLCNFRCTGSNYLYWNSTCSSNCLYPLMNVKVAVERYCNLPCSDGNFFYKNGSCLTSCPINNFVEVDQGDLKICDFECTNNNYLYWNGTCNTSCPQPLVNRTTGVEKYCEEPCQSSDFLYQNASCLSTCDLPFAQQLSNSVRSCYLPCKSSMFLNYNKSCVKSCPNNTLPIVNGILKTCQLLTQGDDGDSNDPSGILKTIDNVARLAANIFRTSNPNSAFMTALAKIVKYVKNLDVPILDSVRDQLNSQAASPFFSLSLTFTIEMPNNLQKCFPKHPLPQLFEASSFHSSFFVNYWESLTTYIILVVFGCTSSFLEKIVEKYWSNKRILLAFMIRLRIISRWNFFLFTLFNTYDDITFFPILEFMTLKFDSAASIVSFITCLFVLLVAILILFKTLFIYRDTAKNKTRIGDINSQNNVKTLYEKWGNYQVLYAGYKDTSFLRQGYILFSTTRIILCYLLVGLLYKHPLVQTVQITIMSVIMIAYILKLRPIKDPLNFIIILTYEILALMVNICVLTLAISDALNTLSTHMQSKLSYTILALNTIINTFACVLTWVYVTIGAWTAFKASRKYGLSGITSWLNVPLASYQNPAMDFDEHNNILMIESKCMNRSSVKKLSVPKEGINKDLNLYQRKAPILRKVHLRDRDLEITGKNGRYSPNKFMLNELFDQSSTTHHPTSSYQSEFKSNEKKMDYFKIFVDSDSGKSAQIVFSPKNRELSPPHNQKAMDVSTSLIDHSNSSIRRFDLTSGLNSHKNDFLCVDDFLSVEKVDQTISIQKDISLNDILKNGSDLNFDAPSQTHTMIKGDIDKSNLCINHPKDYARRVAETVEIVSLEHEKNDTNIDEDKVASINESSNQSEKSSQNIDGRTTLYKRIKDSNKAEVSRFKLRMQAFNRIRINNSSSKDATSRIQKQRHLSEIEEDQLEQHIVSHRQNKSKF